MVKFYTCSISIGTEESALVQCSPIEFGFACHTDIHAEWLNISDAKEKKEDN